MPLSPSRRSLRGREQRGPSRKLKSRLVKLYQKEKQPESN
jgi:hypothetical protein